MKRETMIKGLALLSKAFPFREFDIDFLWNFFEEIDDVDFESAILGIINNCEDIKNIVPIVHKFVTEAKRQRLEKIEKVEDNRCDPPPPEWTALVSKVAKEKG